HADVAHHHLRRFLRHAVERRQRRAERAVRDAFARERLLEDPADRAVVFDDPDRIHCVTSAWVRRGSTSVNRVRPGSLSTSMRPWCWLTKLCASDRPRPVPPCLPLTSGEEKRTAGVGAPRGTVVL